MSAFNPLVPDLPSDPSEIFRDILLAFAKLGLNRSANLIQILIKVGNRGGEISLAHLFLLSQGGLLVSLGGDQWGLSYRGLRVACEIERGQA